MTDSLHSLVARQIRRHLASADDALLEQLRPFLDAISDTYKAADRDRALLERSLEVSSAELMEINEALRSVFLASPDLHLWTTATGIVRRVQMGVLDGHGLASDLSVGDSVERDADRATLNALRSVFAEVEDTGKPAAVEYGVVESGREAIFETRLLPIRGNERVLVIRNVTARARAEHDRFRMLAHHVQEVLWLASPSRRFFLYVNPAFERVWGIARDDLYRNPSLFLEVIHPDDRGRMGNAISWDEHDLEYRVVRGDGTIRWVRDRAFPIRDRGGAVRRVSGIITDITEHKMANAELAEEVRESNLKLRLAQKTEAVGLLAGGIAHDFNNLLSVIMSYGELLHEELDETEGEHRFDVEQIIAASRRGAALTRQVLAFSRQEVIEPQVLDVNDRLRGLEGLLRPLMREDVRLELDLCNEPLRVKVDPSQLEQVIINLAINARDAMPNGGSLRVGTRLSTNNGKNLVAFEVEDDGLGMSDEVQARCFEPFFTTKPEGRGTGLGLATVAGIVRSVGGGFVVESQLNRGTSITVVFPLCEEEQTVPVDETTDVGAVPSARILLVEDDEQVRRVAERILRRAGHEVMTAKGGPEALLLGQSLEEPADLLLTDVVMPSVDGRDLAERLSERWTRMRVLFMSGYTDDLQLKEEVASGRVRMLRKPFTPARLLAAVRASMANETSDLGV